MAIITDEEKAEAREKIEAVVEDVKSAAKNAAEAAKPVTTRMKKAASDAAEAAKPVTEKVKQAASDAAEAAKPVTDKMKQAASEAAEAAKPVTDAAKKAAADAVKKIPVKPEVFVEFAGKQILTSDLISDARKAYKEAGNRAAVRSIRVYVKPEDNTAYFVINDDFKGAIEL